MADSPQLFILRDESLNDSQNKELVELYNYFKSINISTVALQIYQYYIIHLEMQMLTNKTNTIQRMKKKQAQFKREEKAKTLGGSRREENRLSR